MFDRRQKFSLHWNTRSLDTTGLLTTAFYLLVCLAFERCEFHYGVINAAYPISTFLLVRRMNKYIRFG